MRKILFRGKCICDDKRNGYKKGEWIYGSLFIQPITNKVFIFDCVTDDKVSVNPETVGQCTRIKDYGGKYKAYEGDIVQDLDDGALGIIFWDEEEAGFMIEFDNVAVPVKNISYYQVVGNKWDNPELFKEWKRQKENIENERV